MTVIHSTLSNQHIPSPAVGRYIASYQPSPRDGYAGPIITPYSSRSHSNQTRLRRSSNRGRLRLDNASNYWQGRCESDAAKCHSCTHVIKWKPRLTNDTETNKNTVWQ